MFGKKKAKEETPVEQAEIAEITEKNEKEEKSEKAAKQGKREQKQPRPRWRFDDLFAFFALTVAALLFVLGPVLRLILAKTGGETVMNTVSTVAEFCLLAAVALPAWYFVRYKRRGWKIFYLVVLAVFIAGNILGLVL